MPKEQIYLPSSEQSPYWDKVADREARQTIKRKIRAHKLAMIAYGMALIEAATGERPQIKAPKRSKAKALVVDASSILDL